MKNVCFNATNSQGFYANPVRLNGYGKFTTTLNYWIRLTSTFTSILFIKLKINKYNLMSSRTVALVLPAINYFALCNLMMNIVLLFGSSRKY